MPDIRFNAEDHSYWIGDTQLTSATTLVKSITPQFESERMSAKIAARDGITQAEVLRQWEAKGEAGREKGTMVHAYIEDILNGVSDPILRVLNPRVPEMDAFDAAWTAMRTQLRGEVVNQEFIVGDEELRVAGRVDCLIQIGCEKCIFDWKTGKFETRNRFENMLMPFADFTACELVKYSIQMSIYRLILERMNPEEWYGDAYLVHLSSSGKFFFHRSLDLRSRVKAWLKTRVTRPDQKPVAFPWPA